MRKSKRRLVSGIGIALTLLPGAFLATGCSSDSDSRTSEVLKGVQGVVFIQRTKRGGMGDIFQYADYAPGGNIFTLTPPSADGKLTNVTNMVNGDVQAMDLSFDAKEVVYSAREEGSSDYHIYRINLDGTNPCMEGQRGACKLTSGPDTYVYPVYVPGGRIVAMTTRVVEANTPQFRDEYERGVTAQLVSFNLDGSDLKMGPRNLSHRVSPTLASDGRVLMTQWDHLGNVNEGNLMFVNPDMSTAREAYGKEGSGITNSVIKAREIRPGVVVAIATARDRTIQAGKLITVELGKAEAQAHATDLTPQVPGGNEPSFNGVGRYYDAYPVGDVMKPSFLVSWADGPVQSEILGQAGLNPDFGIYLFDNGKRYPLYNNPDMWEVSPIAIAARKEPPTVAPAAKNSFSDTNVLIGALDVYQSSLGAITPGIVKMVRIMEGFSGEEGARDFGLTEFDGHVRLGEVPVQPDGSFAALVPANVPIHQQLLDEFGMAVRTENVWVSAGPGQSRFCGGCHEDRAATTIVQPGVAQAIALGPVNLDIARALRKSTDYSYAAVKGVPWDKALQPILDAKCVSCHNGTPGPANYTYTLIDTSMMPPTQTVITFDLRGVAGPMLDDMGTYSMSHLSIMGPMDILNEPNSPIQIAPGSAMPKSFVTPGSARESDLIKKLNPVRMFPTVDTSATPVRAFNTATHPQDVGGTALTAEEIYLFTLMADMGGQFYSRENLPGTGY